MVTFYGSGFFWAFAGCVNVHLYYPSHLHYPGTGGGRRIETGKNIGNAVACALPGGLHSVSSNFFCSGKRDAVMEKQDIEVRDDVSERQGMDRA